MNKNVKNDLVFVKTTNLESKKCISLPNFHEQQYFQLKTTINHANERDSSFQIQNFVLSVQFNNKTTFMWNFSNICGLVLKASIDWITPTYEFYINVI